MNLSFLFLIVCACAVRTVSADIRFNEYDESPVGDYRVLRSSSSDSYTQRKAEGVYNFNSLDFPILGLGIRGLVAFDFDNDGDDDIYVSNGEGRANGLFVNQISETGSLSFLEKSAEYGLENTDQDTTGVCYGDVDNDGDSDLLVLGRNAPWRMFRNDGSSFALAATGGPDDITMVGCSFGDLDSDGDLDFVVISAYNLSNALAIIPSMPPLGITDAFAFNHPNFLYRNDGGFSFVDVSAESGMKGTEEDVSWGVTWVDYDEDGLADIQVANDNGGEYEWPTAATSSSSGASATEPS